MGFFPFSLIFLGFESEVQGNLEGASKGESEMSDGLVFAVSSRLQGWIKG